MGYNLKKQKIILWITFWEILVLTADGTLCFQGRRANPYSMEPTIRHPATLESLPVHHKATFEDLPRLLLFSLIYNNTLQHHFQESGWVR